MSTRCTDARPRLRAGALAVAGICLTAGIVLERAAVAADTLVSFEVDRSTLSINESLTGAPGDPKAGRDVAIDRKGGNCLACHSMPIPEQSFHGRIAPALDGVGGRLSEGQLRLRVVNSKAINPITVMPAFYRIDGLHRVMEEFDGKPILNAQQVEDLVAYLTTLK